MLQSRDMMDSMQAFLKKDGSLPVYKPLAGGNNNSHPKL
jgi:hypothetical protein